MAADRREGEGGWRKWPLVSSTAAERYAGRRGDPPAPRQLAASSSRVFVGRAEAEPRAFATQLHDSLVAPARSILIMVDPAARLLEIVTGADVRRDLTDDEVELAVLADAVVLRRRRPGRRPHAAASSMLAEHARAAEHPARGS